MVILSCYSNGKDEETLNRQEIETMIKGFGGIFWRTKNLDPVKKMVQRNLDARNKRLEWDNP